VAAQLLELAAGRHRHVGRVLAPGHGGDLKPLGPSRPTSTAKCAAPSSIPRNTAVPAPSSGAASPAVSQRTPGSPSAENRLFSCHTGAKRLAGSRIRSSIHAASRRSIAARSNRAPAKMFGSAPRPLSVTPAPVFSGSR